MQKMIYGIIAGFVLWSALWIASDFALLILSPDWYGDGLKNFTTPILLISLVRSIIISLISGFVAAFIAGRNNSQTTVILGVLLFAFGIYIQAQLWNTIPLWYHIIFLALLIPMTIFGGRLLKA